MPNDTRTNIGFEYRFENIDDEIKVCVTKDHTFGTDAFLLARFSKLKRGGRVCDLGTGCGIIPFLIYKLYGAGEIYGVDIQIKAIEQFKKGIAESGLEDIMKPFCADLKNLKGIIPYGVMDAVICNPPYKISGTGILNKNTAVRIAKHEVLCTIFDVCDAASKLLKTGGELYICQRPERLPDVIVAMRKSNIEPKILQFAVKSHDSEPWLFLIKGKKCSKPFLKILPPLVVKNNGCFFDKD